MSVRITRAASLLFASALLSLPAHALLKFDDGHDEIFVTGTAGIGYDSNLTASKDGNGDTFFDGSLALDYKRHAGLLGVNATLAWKFAEYAQLHSENYANPSLQLEVDKSTGRTTGAVTFSVARDSRADEAINIRTTSWDYDTGLNVKYPVIQRYSLAGNVGFTRRDFTNNADLVDINVYHAGGDLLYALDSERNLLAGYRFRETHTTADTNSRDHAFTIGTSGKILPKISGSVRFGYQFRQTERSSGTIRDYRAATATAEANWVVTKRLTVTGSVSKDFTTLATDTGIDATTGSVTAQYAVNSKVAVYAGVSAGFDRYLDALNAGRHDTFLSYQAGVAYTHNDHLKVNLAYLFYQNWSSVQIGDFTRHSISLNVSSRW